MDEYALLSHTRAAEAQASGRFNEEMVPFPTTQLIPPPPSADGPSPDPVSKKITLTKDDGIRPGSTIEALTKLKPAFPQWGDAKTTAGNSSPMTDGAAAVMMMSRRKAEELNLEILGRHVTTVVTGVAPRHMGVGPVYAIPKALAKAGLSFADVDLFEVNEAFASMMVYTIDNLDIPLDKLNVNGGAIALGHPLGCTGVRQIATGLHELKKRDGNVLVTSMCIGSGQGAAAIFVRETGGISNGEEKARL